MLSLAELSQSGFQSLTQLLLELAGGLQLCTCGLALFARVINLTVSTIFYTSHIERGFFALLNELALRLLQILTQLACLLQRHLALLSKLSTAIVQIVQLRLALS